MQELIKRLKEAKKTKKITLKELAEQSGITLATVNKILSGQLRRVKPEKLSKLAETLGVTTEWLESIPAKTDYIGTVKIACISPEVRVADCEFNARSVTSALSKAARHDVSIAVLPELCLTGYTCGDFFFQETLRKAALSALETVVRELSHEDIVGIVGLPLASDSGKLYNVAAVICHGEVLGIVPKKNLPNYNEFMEKRHFCAYDGPNATVRLFGKDVPFGTELIFADRLHPEVRFAVEICEDVWVADSPSVRHAAAGANAIFNLSASNETAVKADYRLKMLEIQSAKCNAIYAYCSSGPSESTSTTVFSAHNIICENGECLAQSKPFGAGYAEACVDFDFIQNERVKLDRSAAPDGYRTIRLDVPTRFAPRVYDSTPFIPKGGANANVVYDRILKILAYGVKKRVEYTGAKKLLLGISGGSDSTLAAIVCQRALKLCGKQPDDLIAVTMPCFGTTKRTHDNAVALCNALGATLREIDISPAVKLHLEQIGHEARDTVYENAQARERTQVLMDLANAEGGLVIGTGDMSEAALGWSTFNGDQMSMYAAIASVPKTLVKALLGYVAEKEEDLKAVLHDIIDTPVSPELLPVDDKGNTTQLTEDIVGPYRLHDYFLFMFVRKGFTPSKIVELAKLSFDGVYDEEFIRDRLKFFLQRFVSQQYKRGCFPDCVRLGSVDLGKYSMRLPCDAETAVWLADNK